MALDGFAWFGKAGAGKAEIEKSGNGVFIGSIFMGVAWVSGWEDRASLAGLSVGFAVV